jgi:putative ATP-dependent endonuclease of OLD family
VLLAEGATETSAFPVAARRLAELEPTKYVSLEALGICVVDAGSETQIADLAALYKSIGKETFGLCDKQADEDKKKIEAAVTALFMHEEKGFEALVLKNTTDAALARFAAALTWPPHLQKKYPNLAGDYVSALTDYFAWSKGNWGLADFLAQCSVAEIPHFIREACASLKEHCQLKPAEPGEAPLTAKESAGG